MTDAELLEQISTLAIQGGTVILDIYAEEFEVDTKSDGSVVTKADQECETIILEGLKKIAPHIPILAEESAAKDGVPQTAETLGNEFFLVDPLDGTREFVNRTGEFTVNIALIRNGRPVIGVVYAPPLGDLYTGHHGHGAFLTKLSPENPDLIVKAPRSISTRPHSHDGLTAIASRSHRSPETDTLLKKFNVKDFTAAGSSLKFCLLAEGKADIYPRLGRTMEWDTAAGQAVLEAAGGYVTVYPEGASLLYCKAERGFDNPNFIAWGFKPIQIKL